MKSAIKRFARADAVILRYALQYSLRVKPFMDGEQMVKYLLVLFFITIFHPQLLAKDQIIWLTSDAQDLKQFKQNQPYNIASDTDNLLVKALPQYHIELKVVPLPRIALLLNGKESYCVPNRIKTPKRAKQNLYSKPTKLYPSLKLYWLASNKRIPATFNEAFNEASGLIVLADIFKQLPKTVLGVSGGRSFGENLDQQIAVISKNNLFVRGGEHRFLSLVKMLNDNKFDFLLEFPTEIKHVVHVIDQPDKLRSSKIAGIERFVKGFLACSKTEQNSRFIEDVNRALEQLYQSENFYQAHARYIDKVDLADFTAEFEVLF